MTILSWALSAAWKSCCLALALALVLALALFHSPRGLTPSLAPPTAPFLSSISYDDLNFYVVEKIEEIRRKVL